ncbi:MAG TPA: DNA polymerase III subunit delta', partial [Plasticicumulans sp.]|nr:DNA polymerase III subunit delta' [Plasticicumulans sp.]
MTADSSTPASGAGTCEGLPPWLRGIWAQLAPALAAGRLPHALLLAGPEGLGKMAFAQALGEALLCESQRPDHHACGHCRACRLLAAGSHPDLHVVVPAEEGKAIRVDAIRELIGFAALTPQFGGRRVLRLAPAELLNVNAANALLKTLEEPAPGSHLILVSARPARLLPTVRSRCQTIRFAPPPAA